MPTSVKTFAPVLGKIFRITELDKCGLPNDPGEDGNIASDGFITVTLSTETEDGNEILQRKANGAICFSKRLPDAFKRFTMEIQFCDVHPVLVSWLTNARQYVDTNEEVIGFTQGEGDIDKKFAFEMWTGTDGNACDEGAETSGYMLLPYVNGGTIGDITVNGEDAVEFTISGAYTMSGNQWGVGPYDVMSDAGSPAPLPTALDEDDHLLMITTNLAPPESSSDVIAMPDAGGTGE